MWKDVVKFRLDGIKSESLNPWKQLDLGRNSFVRGSRKNFIHRFARIIPR